MNPDDIGPQAILGGHHYRLCVARNPYDEDRVVLAALPPAHGVAPFVLPLGGHPGVPSATRDAVLRIVKGIAREVGAYGLDVLHQPVCPGSPPAAPPPYVLPTAGFPGVTLVHRDALTRNDPAVLWRVEDCPVRDPACPHETLQWLVHEASGRLLAWQIVDQGLPFLPPLLLVDAAARDDPLGAGRGALWAPLVTRHGAELVHHDTGRAVVIDQFERRALGDDDRMAFGGPCLHVPAGQLCDRIAAWRFIPAGRHG